jgi:hypothetical protein
MSRKQYKTPAGRRARVMEDSRDCWKQRATQKQRTIRSQRVTIRDLKSSRDHWRQAALQALTQVQQLQAAASSAGLAGPDGLLGDAPLGEP